MEESIITAIGIVLVALINVIAVVLSNNKNAAATDAKLDKQQEVQNNKLENLTKQMDHVTKIVEVVPVIESKVEALDGRVKLIENKVIG